MRNLPISLIALCALAICLPGVGSAQTVYKWKDARGVTHYSERPPASGKYTARDAQRDPVAATPEAKAAQPPKVDTRCTSARNNLAMLQGANPVQIDSNNDGKPDRTLTDAERSSQAELARSTLKAYNCTETVPKA